MTPKKLSTRRRNDKAVADMVDTVMSDTRWDRLRTRPARLTIVAVMIALLAAIPLAWITLAAWAALGLIMVAIGAWWALRMSVRVIADLTLLGATLALLCFMAVSDNDVATVAISWGTAMAAFWAFEGLALNAALDRPCAPRAGPNLSLDAPADTAQRRVPSPLVRPPAPGSSSGPWSGRLAGAMIPRRRPSIPGRCLKTPSRRGRPRWLTL